MTLRINGISLPTPSALSVETFRAGGTSQYNLLGELVQDNMRCKRRIRISWALLGPQGLAALSGALSGQGFLSCTYPDPLDGETTISCFCAGQSSEVFRCTDDGTAWKAVEIILEER